MSPSKSSACRWHFAVNKHGGRGRSRLGLKCAFESLEHRVAPATFVVTTTANSGPGSLRAAIIKADHNHGSAARRAPLNTIKFKPYFNGEIVLKRALPVLSSHILIKWPPPSGLGTGLNELTVARRTAPGTPLFDIFTVGKRAVVTLQGFNVADGFAAHGGGIYNAGTLTLNNVMMFGNSAVGNGPGTLAVAMGGAIFNSGTLSLNDCMITNNSATGSGSFADQFGHDAYGGAIANVGTLSMAHCVVSLNSVSGGAGQVAGSAGGGAIFNTGTFSVTSGNIGGNVASSGTTAGEPGNAFGGAIMNSRKASLTNVSIGGTAEGESQAFGGAIYNTGTLSIAGCPLGGSAQAGDNSFGGAIYNDNTGTATITGSSVGGSAAGLSGSGATAPAHDTYASYGGGIDNIGNLSVAETYFLDAAAGSPSPLGGPPLPATADFGYGGAINNANRLTVVNVTFINCTATGIAGAWGGAIADSGTMSLTYVTADDNSAATGGGVAITAGSDAVVTSIDNIFENPQGGNVVVLAGTFQSLGHNIFSDDPNISLSPTDLINTDPLLGPFTTSNGGNTETQAPLPGSPAIGGGIGVAGITTDQRGVPRSSTGPTDIGAVQTQSTSAANAEVSATGGAEQTVNQRLDETPAQSLTDDQLVRAGGSARLMEPMEPRNPDIHSEEPRHPL